MDRPGSPPHDHAGAHLARDDIRTSTGIHDNVAPGTRHRYASFDLGLDVDSSAQGRVTIDIGILPAAEGRFLPPDPLGPGSIEVEARSPRRFGVSDVRIPRTRFRFALRLRDSASATARDLSCDMTPYGEEFQSWVAPRGAKGRPPSRISASAARPDGGR